MSKIISYIANANNTLEKFVPQIEQAVRIAEKYAVEKLSIDYQINIIFAPLFDFIPEDHIGGRTSTHEYITISLDTSVDSIDKNLIFETICHELAHAVRWSRNPEYAATLIDCMLFEGMATCFEEQSINENNLNNKQFFLTTMQKRSEEENKKIVSELKSQFNNKDFDYKKIFFNNDELQRWAGYSAGYYLIKKYLSKTNKKACDAITDKYEFIKRTLSL